MKTWDDAIRTIDATDIPGARGMELKANGMKNDLDKFKSRLNSATTAKEVATLTNDMEDSIKWHEYGIDDNKEQFVAYCKQVKNKYKNEIKSLINLADKKYSELSKR